MNGMLNEADREVIRQAAESEKYLSSPVPQEIHEQLGDDLREFVFVPYQSQSRLADLYGVESGALELLQRDWEEARACGALRMHDERAVSFATHVQLANGEAVEVSISESNHEGGLPWYLSYAPSVERLRLMRDVREAGGSGADSSNGREVERPSDDDRDSARAREAESALPPVLYDELEAMRRSEDYRVDLVPSDLKGEIRSLEGPFSSFVWVPQRWLEKILECAGTDLDVLALLNRDWDIAVETETMRSYEGKIQFPISILRPDGATLVEVTIKRDRDSDRPGSKPWFVHYVDDYTRSRVIPGRALYEWAYLGNMNDLLAQLADLALDERWSFEEEGERETYSILKSYLTYTFYRLKTEDKVLEDRDRGIAAFNTGLVDKTYEPIYACFSPSTIDEPWRFEAFCKAGSKQWGKKLVSSFSPLPKRASYFQRKEDLLFDAERSLERDVDHILLDNIDRLPKDFLAEELRGSSEAVEALESACSAADPEVRDEAYDRLRDVIEDDFKIKRRLIHRLDDAIELAQKRVEWNFKTAVPAFYPTKNAMSLLLPLDLTEDESPDVALVVELMESGAYLGQTILTMRMAYNNARLICRPDSDWLNTSLKLAGPEDPER